MISDKQASQVCAFCVAIIVFFICVLVAHWIQSYPDFTRPVEEIPQQYR